MKLSDWLLFLYLCWFRGILRARTYKPFVYSRCPTCNSSFNNHKLNSRDRNNLYSVHWCQYLVGHIVQSEQIQEKQMDKELTWTNESSGWNRTHQSQNHKTNHPKPLSECRSNVIIIKTVEVEQFLAVSTLMCPG